MKNLIAIILLCFLGGVSLAQSINLTFTQTFTSILSVQQKTLHEFCGSDNAVKQRVLIEYGAVYISKDAILPDSCVMTDDQVSSFRSAAGIKDNCYLWGGSDSCLQKKAKESLDKVFSDSRLKGYLSVVRHCNGSVVCNDGVNSDWAFRSFKQAKDNWDGGKNKRRFLANKSDDQIINYQYGGTDTQKPFMFSNAVPGGSQHHLGLAIDVNEENKCLHGSTCEKVLQENGWFRTIKFDRNHFTFLGYTGNQLKSKGLKKVICRDGFQYWVPNVPDYVEYENWKCTTVPS